MDVRTLANVYLRQAEKQQNPRQYLDDLMTARLATLTAQQGGVITSTTVNGKSVTYQTMPGAGPDSQLTAVLMALQALECGLSRIPSTTWAVLR
jgi:hypothetical protein